MNTDEHGLASGSNTVETSRRFRFSLRVFLGLITLLCVVGGWWVARERYLSSKFARRQQVIETLSTFLHEAPPGMAASYRGSTPEMRVRVPNPESKTQAMSPADKRNAGIWHGVVHIYARLPSVDEGGDVASRRGQQCCDAAAYYWKTLKSRGLSHVRSLNYGVRDHYVGPSAVALESVWRDEYADLYVVLDLQLSTNSPSGILKIGYFADPP